MKKFCRIGILLLCISNLTMAIEMELDLDPYQVGDVPFSLGEDLIVKERLGKKYISGHTNAKGILGNLELSPFQLSNDFEIVINLDLGKFNHQILLVSSSSEITTVFDGSHIQFGDSNSKISWQKTGWKSGDAINSIRMNVRNNVAKLYINETFFQTLILNNPDTIYSRLIITGISEQDAIFEIRGGKLEYCSPIQSTSTVTDDEIPSTKISHNGVFITPEVWIKAEIHTVEKGIIPAVWNYGGEAITNRGDKVIYGHFYANSEDVIWGNKSNPEIFVKAWFDISGRIDINYFHVSVPEISVFSIKDGEELQSGKATVEFRYVRHSFAGNPNKVNIPPVTSSTVPFKNATSVPLN
jgi:hypothetical protein